MEVSLSPKYIRFGKWQSAPDTKWTINFTKNHMEFCNQDFTIPYMSFHELKYCFDADYAPLLFILLSKGACKEICQQFEISDSDYDAGCSNARIR